MVARTALDNKAEDLKILDMSKSDSTDVAALAGRDEVCNFCDYFVILTASSGVRAGAIADKIRQALEERHAVVKAQEGREDSGWILLDLYDVIAHIFVGQEIREFYNLDRLWGFCPAVEFPKKDVKRLTRRAPGSTVRKSTARKAKASQRSPS
ncbi:MAG: ribosome silencing factor [Candidatus Omnitrophota bacterium]|nr:ribosome silencing factor [Candidatus Omnitrophota bacterium]